jgi:spore coat polysaccharide biosynthesis predicted glycosyltransferase SpsG
MIKIDVEGYEMRVLEGANKTLTFNDENQSNVQYIMVELNHNTERYNSSSVEVKNHITKNLGFKILINIWPDIIYYRA